MPQQYAVLVYEYVTDILDRRGPYRDEHLALLARGHEAGDVVMGGATGDPVTGGLVVFRTAEAAAAFVEADPYGANGLVVRHRIEPYTVVTGD